MNTTITDDNEFCEHVKDTRQRCIDSIYKELGQSSRGAIFWDNLTHEERAFFCMVAKVGRKDDLIKTAKKKLSELTAVEQSKILKKIQGLNRLTSPFANLSRYEFK